VAIYKDGFASGETVAEVDAHLKECPDCRRHYKLYDTINYRYPLESGDQNEAADKYAVLSARLRRRHRQIISLAVTSMTALMGTITVLSVLLYKNNRKSEAS
jgi:predicted anti-sigma-YlaC factor YlaD